MKTYRWIVNSLFYFAGEVFDYLVAHGRMKEKEARAKFRQVSHQYHCAHTSVVIHLLFSGKGCMHQAQASSQTAEGEMEHRLLGLREQRVENNFLIDVALTPSGATGTTQYSSIVVYELASFMLSSTLKMS